MKTSSKLLTGFLVLILVTVTVFLIAAKFYVNSEVVTGQGPAVSVNRNVDRFNKIKADGRIKVYLTQGPQQKLELKGAQNLIPEVQTQVENGELIINFKNRISRNDKIEAYITAETITGLDFSAGASVETPQPFKGNELSIETSSGSQADLLLQYKNIACQSSSGSMLKLEGSADFAEFKLSSGAAVQAGGLTTNKCMVDASSGSNADIKVLQELSARVNSGSNFTYSGEPSIKDLNSSAGGTIEKK
jgi:hypothetical protein